MRLLEKYQPTTLFWLLAGIFSMYFIFEYYFIKYSALSTDEFVFARHILDYTRSLPYRDFAPYKSTLGYYLLSIPLLFSHDLLAPLFWMKTEITFINIACLSAASYLTLRFFDWRASLICILAILSNQLFLVYGSDLRVDMLTSWFCLFSAIYILRNKFKIAGCLLGIAFLISQKALWYLLAINTGMGLCWIFFTRESQFSLRAILHFNLSILLPITIYCLTWSAVSDFSTVFYSLFYEAYIQAGIDWYAPLYFACWHAVLSHGPALFLIWPLTFFMLMKVNTSISERSLFIVSMASTALILFIQYKQPFPYNFVFTIPAFFLLIGEFITWILNKPSIPKMNKYLTGMYALTIIALVYSLSLHPIYYLMAALPIIMCSFSLEILTGKQFKILFISTVIITGIITPLYQSIRTSLIIDGKYQQTMINITADLLSDNSEYISGIPFLYTKDQSIDGMKNLIGPAVDYLYQPTDKLKPLLLPSLYLDASTPAKILLDFQRMPIKVIINNYRMLSLPPQIKTYIKNNYRHFYGSIYTYAPLITKNQLSIDLKFSGKYRVESKGGILIDKKLIKPNQILQLKQGPHLSQTKTTYRLVLLPTTKEPLNKQFEQDNWSQMIKAILY